MDNKYIFILINSHYKKPFKIVLEKMFQNRIYEFVDVEFNKLSELSWFYNNRICLYEQGLKNGCNIILNYNDNDIMRYLKIKGYDFKNYNISKNIFKNYRIVKKLNKKINFFKYCYYLILIFLIKYLLDNIQKYIIENIGYEIKKGNFERIEKLIEDNIVSKLNIITIIKKYYYYIERLRSINLDKPKKCLNIGIISNNFIFNNLYSDYTIERELSNKNMICRRYIPFFKNDKFLIKYYRYLINKLINGGCDGIIFLSEEGSIIDDNSYVLLEKISSKVGMPFININFNESTSKKNIENKINMLNDLIIMNNKKKIREKY